jgi:hypothetical protein
MHPSSLCKTNLPNINGNWFHVFRKKIITWTLLPSNNEKHVPETCKWHLLLKARNKMVEK